MESFKLLIFLLLLVPTNWALSIASSGTTSVSSLPPSSATGSGNTQESAAATLGGLYRKSRQSRCVRCYDDRYQDDYDRTRYSGSYGGGSRGSSYASRTYDDRPSNWYYPTERYDRYDDRVRYGADRDYDRYYYSSYYRDRNDDRYTTRNYDRYDRDRYDSRYAYDRSPSENRGYGYDNRDRYWTDRANDYYRGGDRYADRTRGSTYDRYGSDDRYYSRYDYRNYRPWDETYRGQSGFDNSGRGYYFASDHNEPYRPPSRPSGPSTPGPSYLPHEDSRPQNSQGGYPDSRPGSSSSSSSPSSSGSATGSDYGNRPRDGASNSGPTGSDNKNGNAGSSWSYVNDREKDAGYKGGIRDKDNQSSSYGSGGRGRPLGGSYLLDRDSNTPEASMMNKQDKPGDGGQKMDTPMASKLTSQSSTSTSSDDRMAEKKDSN